MEAALQPDVARRPGTGVLVEVAAALTAIAAGTLLRLALHDVLGARAVYTVYFPIVVAVAWWCRPAATVAAIAASLACVLYFFVDPPGWGMPDSPTRLQMALFAGAALGVAAIGQAARGARARAVAAERFSRLVIDSSPDCIKVLDLAGRMESMNAGGLRALELDGFDALRGSDYLAFWAGPHADDARLALAAARAGGSGRFRGRCPTARGAERWWDVVTTAILGEDGRPERILVVSRDVTAQRAVEAALIVQAEDLTRSNAELEQFAYIAAHDLQEPIRMIVSYLQILERRAGGSLDERSAGYVRTVIASALRMRDMVHAILDYGRIGRDRTPPAMVSAEDALGRAIDNLTEAIAAAGGAVDRGPLPVVRGVDAHLVRLFQNLVGNAIKFRGRSPPRVSVSAARDGDAWTFAVADNGIGIDPRFAHKLFGLFQRLHPAEAYPGTGIGLAACRKIVELHRGRIWFEPNPGGGTVFRFTLPAADAVAAAAAPAPGGRENPLNA